MTKTDFLGALGETADGAFAVDREGRLLQWSRAAERMTGVSAERAVGRRCWDIMRGRDSCGNTVCRPRCHILTMAEQDEPPAAYDLQVSHSTGGELWVNLSTLLLRNDEGKVDVTVHLFRDVTPRRQAEPGGTKSHCGMTEVASSMLEKLTPRERSVLQLLAVGTRPPGIAEHLSIRVTTVRTHTRNLLKKLGVHTKLEAVALAHRRGLVK